MAKLGEQGRGARPLPAGNRVGGLGRLVRGLLEGRLGTPLFHLVPCDLVLHGEARPGPRGVVLEGPELPVVVCLRLPGLVAMAESRLGARSLRAELPHERLHLQQLRFGTHDPRHACSELRRKPDDQGLLVAGFRPRGVPRVEPLELLQHGPCRCPERRDGCGKLLLAVVDGRKERLKVRDVAALPRKRVLRHLGRAHCPPPGPPDRQELELRQAGVLATDDLHVPACHITEALGLMGMELKQFSAALFEPKP
mmetsp:Transcript_8538/g.26557  ORF Transcript_8538/g.26557 Transcript_8538/m.26557 type:complete len:253 (-) Transcript_8538:1-759(-)